MDSSQQHGSGAAAGSRGRLRDFSTQLAERLKAASSAPNEPMRLAVRIGATGYLLDMNAASEIVATPDITPVPWTRPWFRGMANVRGRLVGVVDLMHLAGRGPLPSDQSQQLLVFGEALRINAGVLVTRAFGLRNLNDLESLGAAPESAPAWESARWRDLDGNQLTELNLGALVASEAFATIGI
ncbi:MAG: chemotaxis protein CheW [Burkholderiaceae bacterium]|jgi:twitching motility protein PilI|nr:chemotaxis protein CheW [Burkholderiaceae bacterium]